MAKTIKELRLDSEKGSIVGMNSGLEVMRRGEAYDVAGTVALNDCAEFMLGEEEVVKIKARDILKNSSHDTFFSLEDD